MPVTSVICSSKLDGDSGKLELSGYAWAGGGNRIIRIDLTTDQGETWFDGTIDKQTDDIEPKHFTINVAICAVIRIQKQRGSSWM